MHIPAELRRRVIESAGNRCEYFGIDQSGQEATFHIDHIEPVSLGGSTRFENLALACVSCSLRKGARTHAIDPRSGGSVVLFHPRRERWNEHFRWDGVELVGISATGRATVNALLMNRMIALGIRREEALRGRHPPKGLY